jgi:hypothetical protein
MRAKIDTMLPGSALPGLGLLPRQHCPVASLVLIPGWIICHGRYCHGFIMRVKETKKQMQFA